MDDGVPVAGPSTLRRRSLSPSPSRGERPRKRRRLRLRHHRPPTPAMPNTDLGAELLRDLKTELVCEICFALMWQPVTTPCQHVSYSPSLANFFRSCAAGDVALSFVLPTSSVHPLSPPSPFRTTLRRQPAQTWLQPADRATRPLCADRDRCRPDWHLIVPGRFARIVARYGCSRPRRGLGPPTQLRLRHIAARAGWRCAVRRGSCRFDVS